MFGAGKVLNWDGYTKDTDAKIGIGTLADTPNFQRVRYFWVIECNNEWLLVDVLGQRSITRDIFYVF